MKRLGLFVGALLFMALPAQAMLVRMSVDEMTRKATHVVRGQVVSHESAWNAERTTILTRVVVRVDERWKGSLQKNATVTLIVEGGEVGDVGVMSEHAPQFFSDEKVVLFLDTDERGNLRVAQDEQGKFTVVDPYVVNQLNTPFAIDRFKAEVSAAAPGEAQR